MENKEVFDNAEELVQQKQRERKVRKGQKKQTFLKGFLRLLTSLLILGSVGYISILKGWYLPQGAFKRIDGVTVQVINNNIVKTSKVQNVIKDVPVPRVPLYMARMSLLRNKLLSIATVDNVYIRRYAFPARILIIVRESAPVISVSPDVNIKPVAAFTKKGRLIIGSDYLPLPPSYKTLKVLSYGNQGDDYRKWDLEKIRELEKISKYVETFSGESVEYIDLRNPNDIFVKVKSVNIRLGRPDDKLYERIKRLPTILPQVKKVGKSVKYVDLSWEKVNYLKLK